MARIYEELDEYQHGRLVVEEISSDRVDVFYVPPPQKLEHSGLNAQSGSDHRVKLLEFDGINHSITILPTNTRAGRPAGDLRSGTRGRVCGTADGV